MGLIKNILGVSRINFKRWITDIRVWIVFLFIGFLLYYYLWPFTAYGMKSGQNCSVWLLPVLLQEGHMSVNSSKTLIYVGMLLLLCDAPFFSAVTPYMLIRSRRNGWWLGECLYIIEVALIYTVFLTLVTALLILPVGIWGNDWGDILYENIFGNGMQSGMEIGIAEGFQLGGHKDMIRFVPTAYAQIYTFFAAWCSFVFLGLLMYLVSLLCKRALPGMCIAGVFVFLDPFLMRMAAGRAGNWIQIFSPVCWTSVDTLTIVSRFHFMSAELAFALYAGLTAVLLVLIWQASRRVTIDARR